MGTITPTKTAARVLLAHTTLASGTITVGSAVDVSALLSGVVFVKFGRVATTVAANQIKFRLEASAKTSGNDEWVPIREWTTGNATTAASQTTLNAEATAGATTLTVSSGTGITAGDLLYLEDNTDANSEWVRVKSISGTTVTLEEAITRTHAITTTKVTDLAEMFAFAINLEAVNRIRLIVDTGTPAVSNIEVQVIGWLTTLDSFATS